MKKEQEPLYKRYRDWDAGPEDRTSHEEAVVLKKIGSNKSASLPVIVAVAPPSSPPPPIDPAKEIEQHLENAILYLFFIYQFTFPVVKEMAPPDSNKDTPIQMRDKRLLQKAQDAYTVLGPLIGNKKNLYDAVANHLKGAHSRVLALHEELKTEKNWHGTFVQHYVIQTPPLHDCITNQPVAADSEYVLLSPSRLVVTREDHLFLSALHVAYHFWDYVMKAFQEQPDTEGPSIYSKWASLWGQTMPTWKFMGATPFRQRIIQLRAMLLSALTNMNK